MSFDLRSVPAPVEGGVQPALALTPALVVKTAVSVAMMSAGLFYLGTGKKEQDARKMVLGGLLLIAALFVF